MAYRAYETPMRPPPEPETLLWRYMPFDRWASLLVSTQKRS